MKRFILFGFLAFVNLAQLKSQELIEKFREAYPHARQHAELCKQHIDLIDQSKLTSNLEKAYAGAFYAVWPEHLSSPLKKLNAFKKGKNFLEQAIQSDKDNAEIHFLRLTIQYNAPSMLGYDKDISKDLDLVLQKYSTIKSAKLKANIKEFLVETDLLSAEQRALLD